MYEEERKRPLFITILSALFYSVGIFIICAFIFRSCKMSDIDIADDVIFDKTVIEVYESDPENFMVYNYGLEKRFESVEANQLLQLKYMYYIPEAKEMQITVKYRTSYAQPPTKDSIPFNITLKDIAGNTQTYSHYKCGEKSGYGYIRLCFDNVDYNEKSEYTLLITQEVDGNIVERGEFLVQRAKTQFKELELNKKNAPYLFKKQ